MTTKKTTLAESCVKVQVTIKTYSGIKADTNAKEELATTKKANAELVRVSKYLLDRDFLKPPIKIGKLFRNQVIYKNTLPWIDADDQVLGEGASYVSGSRQVKKGEWRLLPSTRVEWFEKEVKKYIKNFNDAVDVIVNGYETEIENAKATHSGLGDLFDESDYPTANELRERYVFDYSVDIVNEFNTDDIRVSLSADLKDNIIKTAKQNEKTVKKNADRHTAKQLVSSVEKLADALDKYDPKNPSKNPLRDSSFNDLKDLLDVIDQQLLTKDDDLKSTIDDLRKDIGKAKSQDNLKKDNKTRKSTVKKLKQANKKVKVSDTAKGLF